MRYSFKIIFQIIIVLFLINCSEKQESSTIDLAQPEKRYKLSHITSQTSSWQKGAEKFSELISQKTNGKIKIDVYPLGQLAARDQKTELEMVQSETIEMQLVSPIILALFLDQRFDVFNLPWMFPDHKTAHIVCDGAMGNLALSWLSEKGLQGLAYGANGFRQLTNSKRKIEKPEDMKGIKFRVAGSKMYIQTFNLLEANALTMNYGEVFTSLQQGVIDGQENPLSIIYSSKLYEVQKYLTMWNYSFDPLILVINKNIFNSLSEEEKQIFYESAKEAMEYQRNLVVEEDESLPELLKEKGMEITYLNTEQIKKFKNLIQPVYESTKEKIGTELVNQCIEEVEKISQTDIGTN